MVSNLFPKQVVATVTGFATTISAIGGILMALFVGYLLNESGSEGYKYDDYLEYLDEWGITHRFPKGGYWFSMVKSPMEAVNFEKENIIGNFICKLLQFVIW